MLSTSFFVVCLTTFLKRKYCLVQFSLYRDVNNYRIAVSTIGDSIDSVK